MQIRYYKEYSRFLNRFMEFKVYGHAGRPIVIFPCQSGRFFDWEGDLLASTRELQAILESKGIHPIVDIWGEDVSHDWYWWEKQWVYFLQMTLDDKK